MSDEYGTMKGHPELILDGEPVQDTRRRLLTPWKKETILRRNRVVITVCAQCESMKSVLFLDKDRWFCTQCRNEGAQTPTMVPVTRPRRGKR